MTERNERLKKALERRRRNESRVIPMTAGRFVAVGPMELAPAEDIYGPDPEEETAGHCPRCGHPTRY